MSLDIKRVFVLSFTLIVSIGPATSASAIDIAEVRWDESNIAALRSASLSEIEKFANWVLCDNIKDCSPIYVSQFTWADLEGDGKYALIDVWNTGHGPEAVAIYRRDNSRKMQDNAGDLTPVVLGYTTQSIEVGGAEGSLSKAVRDLNGDGKKEILISAGFGLGPSLAETPLAQWPLVYRLEDGRYVEASKDFPKFYDEEFLPQLQRKIDALRGELQTDAKATASAKAIVREYHFRPAIEKHATKDQAVAIRNAEQLVVLESLRDNVLKRLGRRLTPEQVEEARQWLRSPDFIIVQQAEATFQGLEGYEAEVREAQAAEQQMHLERQAGLRVGKEPYSASARPASLP
jgi:hypothetical protein